MRRLIRFMILGIAHTCGTRIRDFQTGKLVGKALIIPWRGRVHVIGLNGSVRPTFLPQKRLTYWKQELGFTVHLPPDFPNERKPSSEPHD